MMCYYLNVHFQGQRVKPKMRRRRLISDIIWQVALKQKGVKQMSVKQGLIVSYSCILKYRQQVSTKCSPIYTKLRCASLQ
jgi:hypothetical protein